MAARSETIGSCAVIGLIMLVISCASAGVPGLCGSRSVATWPGPAVWVTVAASSGESLTDVDGWAVGRDGVLRSVGRTSILGNMEIPVVIVANSSALVFCHKEYFCGATFVDDSVRNASGNHPVYLELAQLTMSSVARLPGVVSVTVGSAVDHRVLAAVDVWRVARDGVVRSVGRTDERGSVKIPLDAVADSSTLMFCHGFCTAVLVDDHLREEGRLYLEIAPFAML